MFIFSPFVKYQICAIFVEHIHYNTFFIKIKEGKRLNFIN